MGSSVSSNAAPPQTLQISPPVTTVNSPPINTTNSVPTEAPRPVGTASSLTFLSLPTEIRLQIYGLALFPKLTSPASTLPLYRSNDVRTPDQISANTALLRLNKQIHNEVIPLLYEGIVYQIDLTAPEGLHRPQAGEPMAKRLFPADYQTPGNSAPWVSTLALIYAIALFFGFFFELGLVQARRD